MLCATFPKNIDFLIHNMQNKAATIHPTMRLAQQRETNLFLILSEPPTGRTPVGRGVILAQFFICHTFSCISHSAPLSPGVKTFFSVSSANVPIKLPAYLTGARLLLEAAAADFVIGCCTSSKT